MDSSLRDICLLELEAFTGVAELRSVRAWARRRHLKPSHVSKLLKRLEDKLGSTLLLRSASGVSLTEAGVRAQAVAEAILAQADTFKTSVQQAGDERKVLSIGCINFLSMNLLPGCLPKLLREQDSTRFRIVEPTHNNLVPLGLEGAFEIALHIGSLEWTKLWVSKKVGLLRWGLFARKGHPLGTKSTSQKVLEFPFVIPTDWVGQRHRWGEDFFPIPVMERLKGFEVTTADTAVHIVGESDHLVSLPELEARRSLERGDIQEIKVAGWERVTQPLVSSVRSDLLSQKLVSKMAEVFAEEL